MVATFHAEGSNAQNTTIASFSVTVAISAGEAVVIMSTWNSASTTTPTIVTTGGAGSDTPTLIYGPFTAGAPSGQFKYAAWFLPSASAARTGVTLTWASSSPSSADASAMSFSGLTNPQLDRTAVGVGNGNPVNSALTATLSAADEFASAYVATSGTGLTSVAPWTDDGATPITGSRAEHQLLASTAAVQSSFTASGNWVSFCLTFMAAPPTTQTLFSFNSVW